MVRRARVGDAAGMAAVHVASWESSYAGLLPEEYIRARTFEAREAFWSDRLLEDDPRVPIFVACGEDGTVVGFASGGPERTGELEAEGELYSVYLLEEAQGAGLGRALTEAVLGVLRELGMRRAAVWVLATNPARGFYERMGGRLVSERDGDGFLEVAYELPGTD